VSFYPQIGSGVVAQFPFLRNRQWRAITNQLESGEMITLPDAAGGQMAWNLNYEDLTDAEAQTIGAFFTTSQGRFGSFTFVDPMSNLLGWSESLTGAGWQTSQLSVTTGVGDPLGTQRASTLSNGTAGTMALSQTLGMSGDYIACFSAWIQSAAATTVTLQRDTQQSVAKVGAQWSRVCQSGTGATGAGQSTFSVVLAAGQSVNIFGLQVEAQPYPSIYKPTSAAVGIYEETYFADDELTVTSNGPGFSRAAINLMSRI